MARILGVSLLPPEHELIIIRMEFALGDTYEYEVVKDISHDDRSEIILRTEGTLETRRLTGQVQLTGVLIRTADTVSYEVHPDCLFAAGKFRITALSDRAVFYCIRRFDDRKIKATTVRLAVGESYVLEKGKRAFIASGRCQHGDAPILIEAKTADAVIMAEAPSFGLSMV